jgi:hypothetical protein
VKDILGEPAALPLLQFALLKLWETRDHNRITMESYRRLGGARVALANTADEFYVRLIPEDQVALKRILLRMVQLGEGLEVTSNRLRVEALYHTGENPERITRVLHYLIEARLVRLSGGSAVSEKSVREANGPNCSHWPLDAQVEVAHEALVRNWPRLVNWLEEDRVFLMLRRRLDEKAREWVRLGCSTTAGLLDRVQLEEAEEWFRSAHSQILGYHEALPDLVTSSRAALEEEALQKENQRRRERELAEARQLAKERQQKLLAQEAAGRRLRWLNLACVAIAILVIVPFIVGHQWSFKLQELSEEYNKVKVHLLEKEKQLIEKEGQLVEKEGKLQKAQQELAFTNATKAEVDNELNALVSQVNQKIREQEEARNSLVATQEELAAAGKELERARRDNEEVKSQNHELNRERDAHQREVATLKLNKRRQDQLLKAKTTQIDELSQWGVMDLRKFRNIEAAKREVRTIRDRFKRAADIYEGDGDFFIVIKGFYGYEKAQQFQKQFHPAPKATRLLKMVSSVIGLNIEESSRIVNLKKDLGPYVARDGYYQHK